MALANVTASAAMALEDMMLDNGTIAINGSFAINSTFAFSSNYTLNTTVPRYYPSGYTLPQIVLASIVVTVIMIVVVVGNMLVIIAITTEKALKNIQNWFIASLAVADFFLGLIIMPFSLANELMGYWIFGNWWCDVHSAMDVLLSTASIMNLCLISLDRYWSITQAVDYLKKRTPARAAVMITAVWIMSGLICIPPLLGWKVERPPVEQFPQCQVGVNNENNGDTDSTSTATYNSESSINSEIYVADDNVSLDIVNIPISYADLTEPSQPQPTQFQLQVVEHAQLQVQPAQLQGTKRKFNESLEENSVFPGLSEEVGYVLYSALGSFYIPSCIMVFVYIRIYFAAKARARRGIRKPPRRPPQDAVTSFTTASSGGDKTQPPAGAGPIDRNSNQSPRDPDRQIATIEAHPQPIAIPTVTCDFASDISTCSDAAELQAEAAEQKDTLKVFATSGGSARSPLVQCQFRGSTLSVNGELQQQAAALARNRQPSVGIETDMVSEFDPSSSDSGVVSRCAVVKPLKLRLCQPIFGKKSNSKSRRSEEAARQAAATAAAGNGNSGEREQLSVPRVQKPRDPEREKRRIARKKEKRATLILGLIMGSFIACWLPFFFMYILRLKLDIPGIAFSIAFWLGYMNSALNPVIYTIFNKDFRRAFRRILFK